MWTGDDKRPQSSQDRKRPSDRVPDGKPPPLRECGDHIKSVPDSEVRAPLRRERSVILAT